MQKKLPQGKHAPIKPICLNFYFSNKCHLYPYGIKLYKAGCLLLLCCFLSGCFTSHDVQAQSKTSIPVRTGFVLPFTFKVQQPAGDLADRFGWNSSIAGGVLYKTKKSWLYGIEGSYIFSDRIKETSLANSYIFNNSGAIIATDGKPANIFFNERGFTTSARIGKILPILKKNQDSGLLLQAGVGFMQHQLKIDERGLIVPLLRDDYLTGIDRLTNGVMLVQYVGFFYLDKRRLKNFSVGLEFMEAFTKNRRSFNFDQMQAETKNRLDILIGLRLSWILPVYTDVNKDYFYN